MYIVMEYFEDNNDHARPYNAGDLYPALGSPEPSAERLEALCGSKNRRNRPVLLKLPMELIEERLRSQTSAAEGEVADNPIPESVITDKESETLPEETPAVQAEDKPVPMAKKETKAKTQKQAAQPGA